MSGRTAKRRAASCGPRSTCQAQLKPFPATARSSFTATPGDRYYDEPHGAEEKRRHASAQDDAAGKRQSQVSKAQVFSSNVQRHHACPRHRGGQGFRGLLRNWKEGDGVYHKEAQQLAALGPAPQLPASARRPLSVEHRTGRRQAAQGHASGVRVVHRVRTAACTAIMKRLAGFGFLGVRAEQGQPRLQAAGSICQPPASLQTSLS